MRLSVTVIALNQEANIGECLASVSFADEIVVVDTGSTDRTVELARAYTDRVFIAPWEGFGRTKNYAPKLRSRLSVHRHLDTCFRSFDCGVQLLKNLQAVDGWR